MAVVMYIITMNVAACIFVVSHLLPASRIVRCVPLVVLAVTLAFMCRGCTSLQRPVCSECSYCPQCPTCLATHSESCRSFLPSLVMLLLLRLLPVVVITVLARPSPPLSFILISSRCWLPLHAFVMFSPVGSLSLYSLLSLSLACYIFSC